ncbi:MAG: hypothetical protein F4Z40_03980 [Chloroflexi bacterium]|nr:hypothetical protein [Chloroflexota bacterium]
MKPVGRIKVRVDIVTERGNQLPVHNSQVGQRLDEPVRLLGFLPGVAGHQVPDKGDRSVGGAAAQVIGQTAGGSLVCAAHPGAHAVVVVEQYVVEIEYHRPDPGRRAAVAQISISSE